MAPALFPLISPLLFAVTVAVLGFITPGYSHLNHTISRLAIEQYGWLQSINLLQLAVGVELSGRQLTDAMKDGASVTVIRVIFTITAAFLVIAAFFPTDPIENVPLDVTLLTPTGLVHVSVVILFLLLSPLGITKLTAILSKNKRYERYAVMTLIAGGSALLGSIIWFVFYFQGIYLEYRGIFQKAIALPVLVWLVLINIATYRSRRI